MGARQSYQTDIDRRPRSNSTVDTGIEVHNGSGRRPIARYRHNQSGSSTEYDYEEGEDLAGEFANFAVSSAPPLAASGGGDDAVAGAVAAAAAAASSAPAHRRVHGHHQHQSHRGSAVSNSAAAGGSSGMRFSLRASTRNSLLQALTGMTAAASTPSSSSSSAAIATSTPSSWAGRGRDIKCPICHKKIPSDDVEVHLVMCFTRPRIAYNDDVLESDKGECSICLDEMNTGDTIARLPCLCIYHKTCIDEWFKRKNCCPEHPGED